MIAEHFDPPVLEISKGGRGVDLLQNPYYFNNAGVPEYLAAPPAGATVLQPAPRDPSLRAGNAYRVDGVASRSSSSYGTETQLEFAGDRIDYLPLWATAETAAAFGITLVAPGECIRVECPVPQLDQIEYEYGVFAGHWSPYQHTGNRLLTVVCTDLEHHDFPHVFASTDPDFDLVISVGRYWPAEGVIRVADLWVPRGHALYIPPMPHIDGTACIDLHNNRNSARACWGDLNRSSVTTHTLLQTANNYFYWYWNPVDTGHSHP